MGAGSISDSEVVSADGSEQFDVAAYTAASVFNAVALPPNMPDFLRRAIEAQAERERAQPSPMTMGTADETSETEEERDKKVADRASDQINQITQQQQQERIAWAQTDHSFAGQTMNGEQWAKIAGELKLDGAGRDWLLAYLIEKGETPEQAKQTARDIQLAATAMSKPEADRTADEDAAMQRLDTNPQAKQIMQDYADAREQGFPSPSANPSQRLNSGQSASTASGADVLNQSFASAPALSQHYTAVLTATTPLDAPAPVVNTPAPQPTANAGLDL